MVIKYYYVIGNRLQLQWVRR